MLVRHGDAVVSNGRIYRVLVELDNVQHLVALQRGPQVLAFDKSLNTTDAGKVQLPWKNVSLQPAKLPANWIGKEGFEPTNDGTKNPIVLVPYGDASQTGGEVSTWMKKQ